MLCAIHRRSEAGEGRNQLVFYCSSREKPALGLEKQRGDEDIYSHTGRLPSPLAGTRLWWTWWYLPEFGLEKEL